MTFIVTLGHFCEVHGPSMVMCTQAIPKTSDPKDYYSLPIPPSQLCSSCRLVIPSPPHPQKSSGIAKNPSSIITDAESEENQSYISTQYPSSQSTYSSLRKIIMKVFTVETSFSQHKPLIFGDSVNGYTMCLCFKLLDFTARGAERKYCIMVTTNIENELFDDLKFKVILSNLNSIVSIINHKSKHIIENQLKNDDNNDTYMRRSTRIPKNKSLIEILNDEEIFLRLHSFAASLLEEIL